MDTSETDLESLGYLFFFLRSVMENLIGEILDHGDRVTPILGVGLTPLVICYEDRERNKEEAEGYDKEDDGDVHDIDSFTDRGSVRTHEP